MDVACCSEVGTPATSMCAKTNKVSFFLTDQAERVTLGSDGRLRTIRQAL